MDELRINPFGGWEYNREPINIDDVKRLYPQQYKEQIEDYLKHNPIANLKGIVTDNDYQIYELKQETRNNIENIRKEQKKEILPPEYFFNQNTKRFVPARLGKYINKNIFSFYDGHKLYHYNDGYYVPNGEAKINKVTQNILKEETSRNRKGEVIDWIKTERNIANTKKIVNPDDNFINVRNGLINTKTGELLPHTHDRLSTIQLPVTYNSDADDPIIDNFIKSVVPNDTVDLVYEMIGYTLTMNTKGQKAFMFHGSGANGKSVMIDMISALLGQGNISNVSLQDLDENKFKVAQLEHKLINTFDDLPNKALKQNGNFKASVTGGSIDAERKGKDPFTFRPFAKHIYSANTIPKSHDNTDAYFRRWIIIPFPNTFKGKDRDVHLIDKLTTESALSTLLNKALEGLHRLINRGYKFTENESTREMLNQYIQQSDSIVSFVDECCEVGSSNDSGNEFIVSTNFLYQKYKEYCNQNNYFTYSNNDFNSQIEHKFNARKERKRIEGSRKLTWVGIGLLDENN